MLGVIDVQTIQDSRNMIVKRGRGRPRIEDPAERKGFLRGAKQGTIDKWRRACADAGLKTDARLEELLQRDIEALEGVEAMEKRVIDEECELFQRIRQHEDRVRRLEEKKRLLAEYGRADQNPLYLAEIEKTVKSLRQYPILDPGIIEDNAKRIARMFVGVNWMNTKRALRLGMKRMMVSV